MNNEGDKPIVEAASESSAGLGAWISCTERLPSLKTWVLVYAFGEMTCIANRAEGKYGWTWHDERGKRRAMKAFTHWMPLPKPPAA